MTDFLQRIEQNIQSRKLLKRGEKFLVAVSGGLDSMVLLRALEKISARHEWKIVIAHFNHQLRGRASDADEKLVRATAKKLKLPVVLETADVKSFAKKSKLSVEMAARKLRHEFFARAAQKRKIKTIALAHHADDQVELFFLRLLRGAGGEGLAGMKWRSPSPADKTISLIRPLLDFSKNDLEEFARENKIHFRDDATNFSSDFLRNRIRNELLPLLRKNYQPGLNQTVLRLMEIVGAESETILDAAKLWLEKRQPEFEKLPRAIQRRILQSRLSKLNLLPDFDLIERLRQSPNQFVSVGQNLSGARKNSGEIELRTESKLKFQNDELAVNLSGGTGEVFFGGTKFNWEIRGSRGRAPRRKNSAIRNPQSAIQKEFFDADKIDGEIILRHWRPGDKFQPIGLPLPAKLQDLFTNAKIPQTQRRNLILAETVRGEIFWVEGLRISENFKIMPTTQRHLIWQWRR